MTYLGLSQAPRPTACTKREAESSCTKEPSVSDCKAKPDKDKKVDRENPRHGQMRDGTE